MNEHRMARVGGWTAVIAGLVGAAAAVALLVVPPQVGADVFSYPLDAAGHAVVQSAFFVHHLAMAFALFAFDRAHLAGPGRFARVSAVLSIVLMIALAVQELVAIAVASAPYPSPETSAVEAVYGLLSLLLGVALVLFGIAAVRARVLAGAGRWSLLAVGVYLFVPLTPAIMAGFVAGRIAIGVWLLLFAWWGLAMVRWADAPAAARTTTGAGAAMGAAR